MSRKLCAAALSICTLLICAVSAYAAPAEQTEYGAACQALADSGVTAGAELAVSGTSSWQLAIDMGLLSGEGELALASLPTLALQARQELTAAQQDAATDAADAAAAALQQGGAMVTAFSAEILTRPEQGAESLRSVVCGKVLRLLGVSGTWYRVSFGGTEGYVDAGLCALADYSAYEGTWATGTLEEDVINLAYTYLGTPYVYGGSSRSGTDCSGFTMAVFAAFGYSLPHGASDQYYLSRRVSDRERQAGDLVFFNTYGGISHVGLYLGGGQFIHASSSRGVTVNSLYESYYANAYLGAGRVIG